MDDDMAQRPRKPHVLRPRGELVVGLRVIRHHHDILILGIRDRRELEVAHLVGEPAELSRIETGCEILDRGFPPVDRSEVDHTYLNLAGELRIPAIRMAMAILNWRGLTGGSTQVA